MNRPWPLTPTPGSPLAPGQVVGRDSQILKIAQELKDSNNIVISDPRRIGKTAMLDRFCNEPPLDLLAVKIDYQAVRSSDAFLKQTIAALRNHDSAWRKLSKVVLGFADLDVGVQAFGIQLKGAYQAADPCTILGELIGRIDEALNKDNAVMTLILDEVTIGVEQVAKNESPEAAGGLLHQLQALRKQNNSSLRWVLCGSVGFHHILPAAGVTEHIIGDLLPVTVGPLDPDMAIFLFQCLMLGIERTCSDQTAAHAAAATDGLPFLIHHVAHQLRESDDDGDVSQTDVDEALAEFISDPHHSQALTHLLSRVEVYYSNNAGAARALLDVAAARDARSEQVAQSELEEAAVGAGLGREQLPDLLNHLRADHYLVPKADRKGERGWGWRYPVLARIWRDRRHIT